MDFPLLGSGLHLLGSEARLGEILTTVNLLFTLGIGVSVNQFIITVLISNLLTKQCAFL